MVAGHVLLQRLCLSLAVRRLMTTLQDKIYQRVLRHDKWLCVAGASGPVLAALIIGTLFFRDILFLVVSLAALGAGVGALFVFALLRYLRCRYERQHTGES